MSFSLVRTISTSLPILGPIFDDVEEKENSEEGKPPTSASFSHSMKITHLRLPHAKSLQESQKAAIHPRLSKGGLRLDYSPRYDKTDLPARYPTDIRTNRHPRFNPQLRTIHEICTPEAFLKELEQISNVTMAKVYSIYCNFHDSLDCAARYKQFKGALGITHPLSTKIHCVVPYSDAFDNLRVNICDFAITYLAISQEYKALKQEQLDAEKDYIDSQGVFGSPKVYHNKLHTVVDGKVKLHPKIAEQLLIQAVKSVKECYNSTVVSDDMSHLIDQFGGPAAFRPENVPEGQLTPEQIALPLHPNNHPDFMCLEDVAVVDSAHAKDFAPVTEHSSVVGDSIDQILLDLLGELALEMNVIEKTKAAREAATQQTRI